MAVVTTQTNGNRPKLELTLNESARLKLLKDRCFEGTSSFGAYYLYAVEHEGTEKAFFATPGLHNTIVEAKLKIGDEFILRKTAVQNGKKLTPQISIEFVENPQTVVDTPAAPKHIATSEHASDRLKEIMLQSLQDAIEIAKTLTGAPFQGEDIRSIANCLFIARTR